MARRRTLLAAAFLALLAATTWATAPTPRQSSSAGGTEAQDGPRFTTTLTGDSIITRHLSVYKEPEFTRLIDQVRAADVAFTNVEMLFHDYESYAMSESGGTYMRADPALAKDLAWAGFDLVSLANNHSGDYGEVGLRTSMKHVAEAGLVGAGVGRSLAEAREAKFLETANARVALISASSTFPDHARAGRTRGDVPPRPGLNPLRYTTRYVVSRERFNLLRDIASELGIGIPADRDRANFVGRQFEVGSRPGRLTEPLDEDVKEIAAVVRNAAGLAEYTYVSVHAHESGANLFEPAQFLVTFAHAMIDAGADMFIGHGPHVLRAVEIYKGKPIFYSLGDFIFQNETLLRLPSENYEEFKLGPDEHVSDFNARRYNNDTTGFPAQREIWESVVASTIWQGKRLSGVELRPITLGFGKARTVRGRPLLADAALGQKILDDVKRLSAPFGTRLTVRDGVGVIELGAESSSGGR